MNQSHSYKHQITILFRLNDTEWSHFEESVVMSTYLVAFGISKFQKRSSVSKSGIDVNIWATPSAYLQVIYKSFVINLSKILHQRLTICRLIVHGFC